MFNNKPMAKGLVVALVFSSSQPEVQNKLVVEDFLPGLPDFFPGLSRSPGWRRVRDLLGNAHPAPPALTRAGARVQHRHAHTGTLSNPFRKLFPLSGEIKPRLEPSAGFLAWPSGLH